MDDRGCVQSKPANDSESAHRKRAYFGFERVAFRSSVFEAIARLMRCIAVEKLTELTAPPPARAVSAPFREASKVKTSCAV